MDKRRPQRCTDVDHAELAVLTGEDGVANGRVGQVLNGEVVDTVLGHVEVRLVLGDEVVVDVFAADPDVVALDRQ